jgi:hypothetical protein
MILVRTGHPCLRVRHHSLSAHGHITWVGISSPLHQRLTGRFWSAGDELLEQERLGSTPMLRGTRLGGWTERRLTGAGSWWWWTRRKGKSHNDVDGGSPVVNFGSGRDNGVLWYSWTCCLGRRRTNGGGRRLADGEVACVELAYRSLDSSFLCGRRHSLRTTPRCSWMASTMSRGSDGARWSRAGWCDES